MDSLPLEILEMIVDALYLDTESKCAFRSTCRKFAQIGARSCFKHIHLMYLPKSFENLLAISRHPVYSKCVERIFCEVPDVRSLDRDEWLDEVLVPTKPLGSELASMLIPMPPGPDATERDIRHYMREIRRLRDTGRVSSYFTERQLDEGYNNYYNMYHECNKVFDHDYHSINEAFFNMQNLKEIYLSTTHYFHVSNSLAHAMKNMLVLPDEDYEYYGYSGERHLQTLLNGAATTQLKLETLVTDLVGWGAFTDDDYSLFDPADFRPAFRGLKKIILCLGADLEASDNSKLADARYEELGMSLRSAENLRYLALEFGDLYKAVERRSYIPTVNWKHLFQPTTTWSHLHTFHLSIIEVDEDSFVDFFQRHSSTLRDIKLTGIWLIGGEWASAFRRLKDAFSRAHSLDFEGAFGSGHLAVENIVLPMSLRFLLGIPDEDLQKPHLRDHLIAYFLKDGPFPLRTAAEFDETRPYDKRGMPIDALDLITLPVPRVVGTRNIRAGNERQRRGAH